MTFTLDTKNTREAWLIEVGDALLSDIIMPAVDDLGLGLEKPPVSYSINGADSNPKVLGLCAARCKNEQGLNAVTITPFLNDSLRIMDVLIHELIHAVLDNQDGHKLRFAQIAKRCGLVAPMTATTASPELVELLQAYVEVFGAIPHAKQDPIDKKKQKGRSLSVACTTDGCGFKFNTSQFQIDRIAVPMCLVCGNESMKQVIKD